VKRVTQGRASYTGEPIKIGVSACLLGAKVRFDGGLRSEAENFPPMC